MRERTRELSITVGEVGTDPLFLKNLSPEDLVSSEVLNPYFHNGSVPVL